MFLSVSRYSIPRLIVLTAICLTLAIGISPVVSGAALAQGEDPPLPPTGLTVSSEDYHSVSISWDDPQDDSITGYQVLRRSRDGDAYGDGLGSRAFVAIEDDTGTSNSEYTDTSVSPQTRYVYRVKARNSAGLGDQSNYARAETPGVAESPTGLTFSSASHDSITIEWDDPQDGSIDGYQVLRRSRDGDTYRDGIGSWEFVVIEDDTGTSETEYTDTSVSSQTRYVYRVKARNPAGLSGRSSYANAESTAAPEVVEELTKEGDKEGSQSARQQQTSSDATLSSITVNGSPVSGLIPGNTEFSFGVATNVSRVTLVVKPSHAKATVTFRGLQSIDADDTADGHQADVNHGRNSVRFTITAQDGNTTQDYTISVNRGSLVETGWTVLKDLDDLLGYGTSFPGGIWSNDTYIWVSGGDYRQLYAYSLATGEREPDRNIGLASENSDPKGIWSDGETMWVVDSADRDLYAYDLQTGDRDSAKDFADLGDDDAVYYDIWSDGETLWLSNNTGPVIEAFDFDSGKKVPALRYVHLEGSGIDQVAGIWFDRVTMLVVDAGRGGVWGFQSPDSELDLNQPVHYTTLNGAGNDSPGAIWANGETLWVSDTEDGKVYSYNLRVSDNTDLGSITVDGVAVQGVAPGATEFLHRVENSTVQVTLDATPRHFQSTVSIDVADAEDTVEGHQVDLRVGSNSVTIAVTAQDGTTITSHTLVINRASTDLFGWAVLPDLEDIEGSGSEFPHGIWSDATLLWASGGDDQMLYAYKLETGERVSDRDIGLDAENGDSKGIWSDGATMWVLDSGDRKLYAYNLGTGAREEARDFGVLGDDEGNYYGVWSNGETIWLSNGNFPVLDTGYAKAEAYDFDSGERVPALDYIGFEPSGQDYTAGIWSDGATMWVVNPSTNVIFAYDSPESEVNQEYDFQRLNAAGNTSPGDIWSDGETMWVTDSEDGKIYSYNMGPSSNAKLRSINAAGRVLPGFDPDWHSYALGLGSSVSQASVEAFPRQASADVSYSPEDAAPNLGGYQVDLETGANTVTVTVLAQDGVTTENYTVSLNRGDLDPYGWKAYDDFDTLTMTGNRDPAGLASDGSTLWVADEVDLKLYAYDISTEAHKPDQDINLDPAQDSPGGMWVYGTTILVYDVLDRKLYAYDTETGERDESKDLDQSKGDSSTYYGVWSDGDTVWLSKRTGELVAYDLTTGTRAEDEDFDALDGTEGINGLGVWSDGATIWVVDSANDKLRALNAFTRELDTEKDFTTIRNGDLGGTRGIWSDGETMWVSDTVAKKVYSYNMPVSDSADLRKVLVDGKEAVGSTLDGGWYATVESTTTEVTVAAIAAQLESSASLGGADNDAVAEGHQLAIPHLAAKMSIAVTAQNGVTREHTLTVSRVNADSAPKVRVGGSVTGDIVSGELFNVLAVDLVTDELYRLELEGTNNGDGTLTGPKLMGLFKRVRGTAIPVGEEADFPGGQGTNSTEVHHEPKPEGQAKATQSTYYIVVGGEAGATGGYRLSVSYEDEATANSSTAAAAEVLPWHKSSGKRGRYHFRGAIGEPGDVDWIKVTLEADQMYRIVVKSTATGNLRTLSEPILTGLYTGDGAENYIGGTLAVPSGRQLQARIHFYAKSAGVYYASVRGFQDDTGSYDLLVMEVEDDCQPDNTSTHDTIAVGGSKDAAIDYRGDSDWFRTELTGGTAYTVEASRGDGARPLAYPKVLVYDGSGKKVTTGEWDSGVQSSVATYTPERDGTHFIVVISGVDLTGNYRLSVSE